VTGLTPTTHLHGPSALPGVFARTENQITVLPHLGRDHFCVFAIQHFEEMRERTEPNPPNMNAIPETNRACSRSSYEPAKTQEWRSVELKHWIASYFRQTMASYTTLSEAVNDLQKSGYTDELEFGDECIVCTQKGASMDPEQFQIDEFHRFEGNSDPEDQSIVYAISAKDHPIKGILVSAYGMDASSLTQEMVRKLATHPER